MSRMTWAEGGAHPEHQVHEHVGGLWVVAQPMRDSSWWHRRKQERACHRVHGGHWWHPISGSLIDWFCCRCGKVTDGLPKDGAAR